MADATIQTSFAGGEISPQLYARVDLAKFEVGAALLRNFFVDYRGGATNRAGTEFIVAAKDPTAPARLVAFIVSTEASYVLEFGEQYIRFISNGVQLESSPGVAYEVITPYAAADLALLKFTQSADVMTIVHPSYPPANLTRTSDTTFTYTVVSVGPTVQPPTITSMRAPHDGEYNFGYLVTSVDLDGKEESLPSNIGVKHSEGMDELNNRVVGLNWTAPAQPVSRYNIYKWGPLDTEDMVPATVWGFIGSSQTTSFSDNNINPDFAKQPPQWGDPFSGGQFESITVSGGGSGYSGLSDFPAIPFVPLNITGDGTGAAGWAVIDPANSVITGAFLTNAGKNYTTATITANGEGGSGATFNYSLSDPDPLYPSCASYVQQRKVYAGSLLRPESLAFSQPGLYDNFCITPVALATDALSVTIASLQVNTIKSMVPVSYGLLAFTTGGCWLIGSTDGPTGAISPETISFTQQASPGANDLPPLLINYDILFGAAKGNRILRAGFAWERQSFTTSDTTQLAPHLFDSFETIDWCYAESPFKLVWIVRDDGRLLSMTYVPEQEVYAWARHDTQGLFKSICSVPEGDVDAVYVIVQRHIPNDDGEPCFINYIERFHERGECCILDAWHLDCALQYEHTFLDAPLYINGDTRTVGAEVQLFTYDPCSDTPENPVFNEGGGGSTTYLMEAREALSPELVALCVSDPSLGPSSVYEIWGVTTPYVGFSYDRIRRNLMCCASLAVAVTGTNDTGHDLWTGDTLIAPTDPIDFRYLKSMQVCVKNLDTDAVEWFNTWSDTQLVPTGIGGTDGTARRAVMADAADGLNIPAITDFRTGNYWTHVFSTFSPSGACFIYVFRPSADYAQEISPLFGVPGNSGHMEPIGAMTDWMLVTDDGLDSYILGSPSQIEPDEVTADYKLPYFWFASPLPRTDYYPRWITTANDTMYVFGAEMTGARQYLLQRFDLPSAAIPNNAGTVGGGFTDVTPWGPTDGPNTGVGAYTHDGGLDTGGVNKNLLYQLPVTNELVLINKLLAGDTGVGVTDPTLTLYNCTYYNIDDDTFDFHEAFVRGYMTAAWTPTLVAADAAWSVIGVREMDLDLNVNSMIAPDYDYTKRKFFFTVEPVVGGVWTPTVANRRVMIVQYEFIYGSAPVATVIAETGWDTAYAAYGTAIGNEFVVEKSIPSSLNFQPSLAPMGVFDEVEDAYWFNGTRPNFIQFDPQPHEGYTDYPAQWLRLSILTEPPVPPTSIGDCINLECGELTVTAIVSPYQLTAEVVIPFDIRIPDDPDNLNAPVPAGDWSITTPTRIVTGLEHLEGKEVWGLADGIVVGPLTVEAGQVDIGFEACNILIGLRYNQQIKTLYLTNEGMQRGTEQGKRKFLQGVTLRVDCTRGLQCGTDFDNLTAVPDLILAGTYNLYTGDAYTTVWPDWNTKGEICIQQQWPLPASVLGVIVGAVAGDTGA